MTTPLLCAIDASRRGFKIETFPLAIMNSLRCLFVFLTALPLAVLAAEAPPAPGANAKPLFDGRTLAQWEGNPKLWRVEDGCLTGGSLTETVRANDFLATTRDYTNFIVRLKIKLTGTNGFINSGFQIRSQRVPNNSEMAGYQCDFGEPSWYGAIYDESRRNKLMASSDMKALRPVLRVNDWNDYVIRADGARVTTWINGVLGVDYIEQETGIPNFDWGKLGIQVHGGGKALVQVKDITIEELPPTPPGKIFRGAPEPKKSAQHNEANRGAAQTASKAEAVAPEEEKARFTLAPGFEMELVVAEDLAAGFGKFITVDWDQHGNLWTMTALEYPVDGNENPAAAKELYASKAKDKVLVYARDRKSPTGYASQPRVFAEGLAIPLGILPYKNGVYVQHGTEIVFLSDTDGDGKSDKRDVILGGFGVQDSHLFPHQFTRAPGGWIWFAQGAFNYGKVKTTKGVEIQFDQTRMAKFRPDGSDFDITSQGPCNIWGFHMTMEGETWIQEANDFGYPAMPFHEYANYPGCSQAQWKSYAPEFPGTAPHFQMGGTGLSGLAMTDKSGWPEAYNDVIYIANPITRKIQAIQARREGPRYALNKLPDFIQSSDEMFRPVALRLGPDGCLYIVDWYNKIISHNEVARNHPDRDKKRGRIWRVRPADFQPLDVPDFTKLSGDELLAKLGGENTTQSHLAWQAIGDRGLKELAPKLKGIVSDQTQTAARRIAALWALEGLDEKERFSKGAEYFALLKPLLADANRNIRREAIRSLGAHFPSMAGASEGWSALFDALDPMADDADPEVRSETIKTVAAAVSNLQLSSDIQTGPLINRRALPLLGKFARSSLDTPTMKSTHNGKIIKTGVAYEREFERYLVRLLLERGTPGRESFFDWKDARALPVENRLLFALALEPKTSAQHVAMLLPFLIRAPGQEELLRLAQFPEEPGVSGALKVVLQRPATSAAAMEALLKVRTKLDAAKLTPLLNDAARQLLASAEAVKLELGTKLASSFQLTALEPQLVKVLEQGWGWFPRDGADKKAVLQPQALAALQALRELKSDRVDLFATLAAKGNPPEQDAAIGALAAARDPRGPQQLASLFPNFTSSQRRSALASLSGSKPGAAALVRATKAGSIAKDELDGSTLDKLQAVLGDDAELAALMQEMAGFFRPALRLNGEDNAWAETDLTLDGPFTVETWVKLDAGIDNNDGILGVPGELDMNFFGGLFRVWVGGGVHDAIVAKRKMTPEVWTHLAVTRDAAGQFRIYQNGELDSAESKPVRQKFENVRLGWTGPAKGTAGWLSEFRIWNRERTAAELRADFDRSFSEISNLKSQIPAGLVGQFTGASWGKLHSGARVTKTADFPPILTPTEAAALAEKFAKFHALAGQSGDVGRGKAMFTTLCQQCHSVGGTGGQVGPVLSGAGALGVEALLRNILAPNAAMEPGYRVFRVELKDGDVLDGIRVSEDKDAIVLRRPNLDDARLAQKDVRKAAFTKSSMMPEGLLDALKPEQVSDLFAYLKTLK